MSFESPFEELVSVEPPARLDRELGDTVTQTEITATWRLQKQQTVPKHKLQPTTSNYTQTSSRDDAQIWASFYARFHYPPKSKHAAWQLQKTQIG